MLSSNSFPLFNTSSLHDFFPAPVKREHTCSSMYDNTLSLTFFYQHHHPFNGCLLLRCVWHRACTWLLTIRTSTVHSEQEQHSRRWMSHGCYSHDGKEMVLPMKKSDRRSHRDDHRLSIVPVWRKQTIDHGEEEGGRCLPHCWQHVHRCHDHDVGRDLRTRDTRRWASVWEGT